MNIDNNTPIVPVAANKVTRKGSGRTKGSYSFVPLTMAALSVRCADPTITVLVSRKWAEAHGFTGLVARPASNSYESIQGQTPNTLVTATVTDLDEV